ncbi:hypothetical protein IAT38_007616 [Cryptococcus sp. DSM 104549]
MAQQNIVIIGASMAGHNLANELATSLPATHRVLLIDALDFAYFPIAALRAAVVPGWEDRISAPLTTEHVFPAGSPHKVIAPNKVVELRANSVVLERPFEGSTEVPFFRCVVATGASQPSPMRPVEGSTREDLLAGLRKTQKEIAKAKKVVVIGGGPSGIEFAGEVKAAHPSTSVTIVHSDTSLLTPNATPPPSSTSSPQPSSHWSAPPTNPKLSKALEKIFAAKDIDVVLGDRVVIPQAGAAVAPGAWDGSFGLQGGVKKVTLKSGKVVEADFVFVSVGNTPNTWLVEAADKGAITNRLVAVDDYLKIKTTTPSSIFKDQYYSIGDASAVPGLKTSYLADVAAKAAGKNILAEVQGKSLSKYASPGVSGLFIPVGPNDGAGSLTLPIFGTWTVGGGMVKMAKAKDLMVGMAWAPIWKGAEKVVIPAAKA